MKAKEADFQPNLNDLSNNHGSSWIGLPSLERFKYYDECLLHGNMVEEMKTLNETAGKGDAYLNFHI